MAIASKRKPPIHAIHLLPPMLTAWIVFCHDDELWGARALQDGWPDLLVHLLCNHMSESLTEVESVFLFAWTNWLLSPPCESYILVEDDKPKSHVKNKMSELLSVHHPAFSGRSAQLQLLKEFQLREIAKEATTQE